MLKALKWLIPTGGLAGGLYMLDSSYQAYGKWYHERAQGDFSSAELYEIEFWFKAPVAMVLIVASVFLVGRWSAGRSAE